MIDVTVRGDRSYGIYTCLFAVKAENHAKVKDSRDITIHTIIHKVYFSFSKNTDLQTYDAQHY